MSTLTTYPAAQENSPMDGQVGRTGTNQTFAAILAGAGNDHSEWEQLQKLKLKASTTTNQFQWNYRVILCFDTSSISTDDISSAVVSPYGLAKSNGLGSTTMDITGVSPGSTANIQNTDYVLFDTTSFGNITYANYAGDSSQYEDITLNGTGEAYIEKTGVTSFGAQLGWDIAGSFGGSWSSSGEAYFHMRGADYAGTTQDPKLVVIHDVAPTFIPRCNILF